MVERRDTYTGYSIGCAAAWAAILVLGRRRLDAPTRRTLHLVCGGWWVGWTSATIARAGYPPAKPLTPTGARRLRDCSVVLMGLGLAGVVRMLVAGRGESVTPPDR